MSRLIPNIEEIKADYNEIITLMSKLKTKEDVENFEKEYKVIMEINYDRYNDNEPIEVIRCEHWNNLDYIYYYMDGSKPMFDVWCDIIDCDFIDGANIDNLEKHYVDGIKWIFSKKNLGNNDYEHTPYEMANKLMEFIRDFSDDEELIKEETIYVAEMFSELQESEEYNALIHYLDRMFMSSIFDC